VHYTPFTLRCKHKSRKGSSIFIVTFVFPRLQNICLKNIQNPLGSFFGLGLGGRGSGKGRPGHKPFWPCN